MSWNLKGAAMAAKLGWDPSKVSTIEHGKARPSEIDLVQLPGNLRTVAMAESTASKIFSYSTLTVPGLLRTSRYAECPCRETGLAVEEQIPALVQIRMDRQAILRKHDRPDCVFYVHELALQQRLGDDRVMADQYLKLLFNAHIVRIVPSGVLVNSAGILLWEYDKAMPVAYSETDLTQVFVQDRGAIARTRLIFDRLAEVALDEEQSRRKPAEYVNLPREDLDDPGPHSA